LSQHIGELILRGLAQLHGRLGMGFNGMFLQHWRLAGCPPLPHSLAMHSAELPSGALCGREPDAVADFAGIRAVASDMDGTFLRPDHEAPAANLEAVRQVEELGLHFLFCTGRNRASAQARLRDAVNLSTRPGVFLNGAAVYGKSGSIIHERTVSVDVVVDMLGYAKAHSGKFSVVLCHGDAHFVSDLEERWALHLHKDYDDPEPSSLGGYAAAISTFRGASGGTEPPQKAPRRREPHLLHFIGSREDLDAGRERLEALAGGRVKFVRALPTCLTLLHPLCSKADGLEAALKEFGSTLSEAIAFGDAENDVEMLQGVKIGVAMGNAMPTVKECARWHCAANSAEPPGVAQVLADLLSFVNARGETQGGQS